MKKSVLIITLLSFLFVKQSFALSGSVTASVAAQNTFTDTILPDFNKGYLNVSISGTWVGTVTLQRAFDSGSSWLDVETFTSNDEGYLVDVEHGNSYRIGIKTGNYTSGTAVLRLSK